MRDLALDNPAWRFASELYGKPGVAAELLAQQDEFGLDISLLLFCLWAMVDRRSRLTAAELQELRSLATPWNVTVVQHLRVVRRHLKTSPCVSWPAVAGFRVELQRMEIQSERLQIALLFEWAETRAAPLDGNDRDPIAADDLDRVLEACGGKGRTRSLDHLRVALGLAPLGNISDASSDPRSTTAV